MPPTTLNLNVDQSLLDAYDGPVPKHIAIIMDGNGRWAESRGLQRIRGHHQGAHAVRRTVEACRYLGVDILTLYAFSSQNWGRPQDEISGLMTLFDIYIKRERKRLIQNQVGLRTIGDPARLPPKLIAAIKDLEDATNADHKMTLQVAVSYGGREEIVHAARQIALKASQNLLDPADLDQDLFAQHLFTAGQPDPDLLIRTSGEVRLSNFLLWQLAYAEIFVTDTLWPDFDEVTLLQAIRAFGDRERRFGLTGAQLSST